jgi:hypothetical protein
LRTYSKKIALIENDRGVYSLDPSIGCFSGMKESKNGCYEDCYSAKSAKLYGYDFTKTVLRDFESKKHLNQITNQIKKIDMPFVRMGSSGDPSENWQHTIKICKLVSSKIKDFQIDIFNNVTPTKEIVIITKHWTNLSDSLLDDILGINICINTSVSAIDNPEDLQNRIDQYERLKPYCKSVLRIVSFDFNKENEKGLKFSQIQERLFKNDSVLDTVFRSSKSNQLVKDEIINVKKSKFLGKNALISKYNKKAYFGNCKNCIEMCGINIK